MDSLRRSLNREGRSVFGVRALRYKSLHEYLYLIHGSIPGWFTKFVEPILVIVMLVQFCLFPWDHHISVNVLTKSILKYVTLIVSPSSFADAFVQIYVPTCVSLMGVLFGYFAFLLFSFLSKSLPQWWYALAGITGKVLVLVLYFPFQVTLVRAFGCTFFGDAIEMADFEVPRLACSEPQFRVTMVACGIVSLILLAFSVAWSVMIAPLYHAEWSWRSGPSGRFMAALLLGKTVLVYVRIFTMDPDAGTYSLIHPIVGMSVCFVVFVLYLRYIPHFNILLLLLRGTVISSVFFGYIGMLIIQLNPAPHDPSVYEKPSKWSQHPGSAPEEDTTPTFNPIGDSLNGARFVILLAVMIVGALVGFIFVLCRVLLVRFCLARKSKVERIVSEWKGGWRSRMNPTPRPRMKTITSLASGGAVTPPESSSGVEVIGLESSENVSASSSESLHLPADVRPQRCCDACGLGGFFETLARFLFQSPHDIAVAARFVSRTSSPKKNLVVPVAGATPGDYSFRVETGNTAIWRVSSFFRHYMESVHSASVLLRIWHIFHLLDLGADRYILRREISLLENSELLANTSLLVPDTMFAIHCLVQRTGELDQIMGSASLERLFERTGSRRSRRLERNARHELRRAMGFESEVRLTLQKIWGLLLNERVSTVAAAGLLSDLVLQEKHCLDVYKRILEIDPQNEAAIRRFANFLRNVACDPLLFKTYEKKFARWIEESDHEHAAGSPFSPMPDRHDSFAGVDAETVTIAQTIPDGVTGAGHNGCETMYRSSVSGRSALESIAFELQRRASRGLFSFLGLFLFVVVLCALVYVLAVGFVNGAHSKSLAGELTLSSELTELEAEMSLLGLSVDRLLIDENDVLDAEYHMYVHWKYMIQARCSFIEGIIETAYAHKSHLEKYWREEILEVTSFGQNESISTIDALMTIVLDCTSDSLAIDDAVPETARDLKCARTVFSMVGPATDGLRIVMEGVSTESYWSVGRSALVLVVLGACIVLLASCLFPCVVGMWVAMRKSFWLLLEIPKTLIFERFRKFDGLEEIQNVSRTPSVCVFACLIIVFVVLFLLFTIFFALVGFGMYRLSSTVVRANRLSKSLFSEAHILRTWMSKDFYHEEAFFSREQIHEQIRLSSLRLSSTLSSLRFGDGVEAVDHNAYLHAEMYARTCDPMEQNTTIDRWYCYSLFDLVSTLNNDAKTFASSNATIREEQYVRAIEIVDPPCSGTCTLSGPLKNAVDVFSAVLVEKTNNAGELLLYLNVFVAVFAFFVLLFFYILYLSRYPGVLALESVRAQKLLLQLPETFLQKSDLVGKLMKNRSLWDVFQQNISIDTVGTIEDLMNSVEQLAMIRFDHERRVLHANGPAKEMFSALRTQARHGVVAENLFGNAVRTWMQNPSSTSFSSNTVLPVEDGECPVSFHVARMAGDSAYVAFVRSTEQEKKQAELVEYEKARSDELLYNILPKKIADIIKIGEKVPFATHSASVFFADLVEFTRRCSEMPPDVIIDLLDRFFRGLDDLCDDNSCEKIKTNGDCFVACCGVPEPVHDHPKKSFNFAVESFEFLYRFNAQNDAADFNLRIGVNSGKVIAGVVGRTKWCYDIWGDDVNIASRMESTALNGTIQVSRATYSYLYNDYDFTPKELQIKGKGLMKTYSYLVPNPFDTEDLELAPSSLEVVSVASGNGEPSLIIEDSEELERQRLRSVSVHVRQPGDGGVDLIEDEVEAESEGEDRVEDAGDDCVASRGD